MAQALAKQIEEIADKDRLHRLIDEMPPNAQVLILAVDYDKGFARNGIYGHPTSERLLWMLEEFKMWLFATAELVGECDHDHDSEDP